QERRTYISEQFTTLLDFLEFGQSTRVPAPSPAAKPAVNMPQVFAEIGGSSPVARNKRKVLIVHGRDNEAKHEVARFLTDLGLEPIILHEQASSGMTIIEKIEQYTNDADFAIALYTPCDHERGAHGTKVP